MQAKDIRIHITIAEKLKIVNYANQNSINIAADKNGIERKSIRIKKIAELLKMPDKSIKSTLHYGRKAETDEVENEIVDWILMNRSLGISVSSLEGNY